MKASDTDKDFLKMLLDYSLAPGAGNAIDYFDSLELCFSETTAKLRYVKSKQGTIMTIRAGDMHVIPRIPLALALHKVIPYPKLRVVVVSEIADDISEGGTVFSRHIIEIDDELRAGDEALLVDEHDRLIGIITLRLSPQEILFFTRGAAGVLRERIEKVLEQ